MRGARHVEEYFSVIAYFFLYPFRASFHLISQRNNNDYEELRVTAGRVSGSLADAASLLIPKKNKPRTERQIASRSRVIAIALRRESRLSRSAIEI